MALTDEQYNDILSRIECGESVNKICKSLGIHQENFYKHMRKSEENADKYARAKAAQQDFYANQIIDIADDVSKDICYDKDGKPYIDGFNAHRAKIMIDARKWTMAKLAPKKYGDKIQQEITSPDGSLKQDTARTDAILEILTAKHAKIDK
jgi:hypothetical protein